MRRARAENATTVVTIFVNPRQFNVAADFTRYPRNEARDLAIVRGRGRRPRLRARRSRRSTRRASTRPCRVGARRPAARGRGAARPLRWRRDRRGDPVRPRRRRARLLRPEGRPAGHGHPPDGARPRDRHRGRRPAPRSASRTASRSRRATSTSRRSSGPPRRSCGGRCWRPATRWEAGERSADALRDAMRATSWPQEPLAEVEYVSVADGLTLAELDRSTGRRSRRWPSGSARPASSTTRSSTPTTGTAVRLTGVTGCDGRRGSRPRPAPARPTPSSASGARRRRPRSRPRGSGR